MIAVRRAGLLVGLGFLVACGLPMGGTLDETDAGDAAARPDAAVSTDGGTPGADGSIEADAQPQDGASNGSTDAAADASFDGGARADGAADAASDAASDARADGCAPRTREDCTNGVDDDCDGLTDCADPECSPDYECVPSVPSGWTSVALAIGSRSGCTPGFATPKDVVLDPTGGPAICTCTCNSSGNASCTTGSATFYGPGILSDCATLGTFPTDVGGGGCQSPLPGGLFGLFGTRTIPANANLRVSKAALVPNQCSGAVQKSVAPAGAVEGKRCAPQATAVGAGCGGGFVCARRPTGAYMGCVAKAGSGNACPAEYPAKHDTGTSLSDTRACSTCTCGTTATCGAATVTFYETSSCGGATASAVADDTCRAMATPGLAANAWRYDAPVLNEGCQKTADAAPTGGLTFANAETICCR